MTLFLFNRIKEVKVSHPPGPDASQPMPGTIMIKKGMNQKIISVEQYPAYKDNYTRNR